VRYCGISEERAKLGDQILMSLVTGLYHTKLLLLIYTRNRPK
jgi:hypothetical protein